MKDRNLLIEPEKWIGDAAVWGITALFAPQVQNALEVFDAGMPTGDRLNAGGSLAMDAAIDLFGGALLKSGSRFIPEMTGGIGRSSMTGLDGVSSISSYADLDPSYVSRADLISNASTFRTHGLDTKSAEKYLNTADGQNMLDALWAADHTADASTVYARAMDQLSTGLNAPKTHIMNTPLVKIVPEGNSVSAHSPFFTTKDELMNASQSGGTLADYFGIPLNSEAPRYSIFEIRPNQPAGAFSSKVAPTTELGGVISRTGGGTQYLVPNRHIWTEPSLIGTIDN